MIVRVSKIENPFVQVDKGAVNDERLSWKARGMLVYLLSKPDDWTVRVTDLVRRAPDGEAAVRSGLQELQDAGYITVRQDRKPDGTWAPTEYTVYEHPQAAQDPQPENHQPLCGFPLAVEPVAENRPITNNDSTNTKGPLGAEHTPAAVATRPGEDEESRAEQPATFREWHQVVVGGKNKNAVLRWMITTLFPGLDPPDYGYIGRVARDIGGPGRLAELLWTASARPPTGDILRFCQGIAKREKEQRSVGKRPGDGLVERNGGRVLRLGVR